MRKRLTRLKLCTSILRKNKGFSVGLFLMAVLSTMIALLGANFMPSSNATVNSFLKKCGTPDVVYATNILPNDAKTEMESVEGVASVYPRFICDARVKTKKGIFSVRVFRHGDDSPFTHSVLERYSGQDARLHVALSKLFADHNGLRAGDPIVFYSPLGEREGIVNTVVTNPETLDCRKDDASAYENDQFGYAYLSPEDFDSLFSTNGVSNQWLVYFEKGITNERKETAMESLRAIFDASLLSETETSNSEALAMIRDHLQSYEVFATFIPLMIFSISLGFSFIFLRIIVQNQRKTIGLLRALGYSTFAVIKIFIGYTLIIDLFAFILGIPLGWALLSFAMRVLADSEWIFCSVVKIAFGKTFLLLCAVPLIGIVASALSARTLSKIDPVEAYGGGFESQSEPPKFVQKIKASAFFKISLAKIFRSGKRQIVGALCIAACIVSMCVGFEGVKTVGHPTDALYGGRLRYDLCVRSVNAQEVAQMQTDLDGLALIEPTVFSTAELFGESVKICTTEEGSKTVFLHDPKGKRIYPQNGVIIDEMRAKTHHVRVGDTIELNGTPVRVDGIAREILSTVLYLRPETAQGLGFGDFNGAMLKVADKAKIGEIKTQISEKYFNSYIVELSAQKKDLTNGFFATQFVMFTFAMLSFGIGSLLILNMTTIDFNEQKSRYAILRALGTPVKKLGAVACAENLFRVIVGAMIALPLCYGCCSLLLYLLSTVTLQCVMIDFAPCLLLSCLFPVLYVAMGIGISLSKIKKMKFTEYLNAGE